MQTWRMTSIEGWCNYTFTFLFFPFFPALYFCFSLAPDERPLREEEKKTRHSRLVIFTGFRRSSPNRKNQLLETLYACDVEHLLVAYHYRCALHHYLLGLY